jgi:hypothetical protein
MADTKLIMEILIELQEYYRQDYNETQLKVISRQLEEVPDDLLRAAVERYFDGEDRWLPKGNQLVALAKKICGYANFGYIPEKLPPPFWAELQELKAKAYREGVVDPNSWSSLINRSQRASFLLTAETIRKSYQAVLQPQDEAACLVYAKWDEVPSEEPSRKTRKVKDLL